MATVYNKSKELVEKAVWSKCPSCKGFGGLFNDDNKCDICNGYGSVWLSDSGWTRAKYSRDSKLY